MKKYRDVFSPRIFSTWGNVARVLCFQQTAPTQWFKKMPLGKLAVLEENHWHQAGDILISVPQM
jgi:hypothetical protein